MAEGDGRPTVGSWTLGRACACGDAPGTRTVLTRKNCNMKVWCGELGASLGQGSLWWKALQDGDDVPPRERGKGSIRPGLQSAQPGFNSLKWSL